MDAERTVFTTRQGKASGLTAAQLRGAAFRRPASGCRVVGPPPTTVEEGRDELIAALTALARPDQFFSHATAALLHGMPIPRRLERGPVHLASPSFTGRMRRPGVVGHRIKSEVVEVAGLRAEAVADTFVHLATLLSVEELVAVGDWIVDPRRTGSLTIDALADATRRYRGARGMAVVDRALALVRPGAESAKETQLRLRIIGAGLPEPVLQLELREPDGRVWARIDLAYPELRLAIEYDGEQHRTDDGQYQRDIRRLRRLQSDGWYVIRVTKADLQGGARGVLAHIAHVRALRMAAAAATR
ncbi:endonuclease domain-containing protein [Agrococcus sediminis]|nr:DUF559 domain-containing protein [Agrococcus sediminis]